MRYCKYCGIEIDTKDTFCSHCGKKIEQDVEQAIKPGVEGNDTVPIQKKSTEKLCCELAYFGALFWLPLVFFPKEKNAKYYANQGLWILILSVVSCWGIRILGMINRIISGSILGIIFGGIYSLIFILFLIFMFYLFVNCLKSAMRVHRDEIPDSILFFEERAIIK
ncbi:MAG: zinc-ribbon domain-containing protein [Lachnotalea sp.]